MTILCITLIIEILILSYAVFEACFQYDCYLHRSKGFVGDYFGEIGEPYKVSPFAYYLAWLGRYRRTKVPFGSTISEVKMQAAINGGAHPESHAVLKHKEHWKPEPISSYRSVW